MQYELSQYSAPESTVPHFTESKESELVFKGELSRSYLEKAIRDLYGVLDHYILEVSEEQVKLSPCFYEEPGTTFQETTFPASAWKKYDYSAPQEDGQEGQSFILNPSKDLFKTVTQEISEEHVPISLFSHPTTPDTLERLQSHPSYDPTANNTQSKQQTLGELAIGSHRFDLVANTPDKFKFELPNLRLYTQFDLNTLYPLKKWVNSSSKDSPEYVLFAAVSWRSRGRRGSGKEVYVAALDEDKDFTSPPPLRLSGLDKHSWDIEDSEAGVTDIRIESNQSVPHRTQEVLPDEFFPCTKIAWSFYPFEPFQSVLKHQLKGTAEEDHFQVNMETKFPLTLTHRFEGSDESPPSTTTAVAPTLLREHFDPSDE